MKRIPRRFRPALLVSLFSLVLASVSAAAASEQLSPAVEEEAGIAADRASAEQTFTIRRFLITGSTLFSEEDLAAAVAPFVGRRKSTGEVEAARDALERFFHDRGYPTVMVNIPEQEVRNKVIRLEVVENPVGAVTVTGNRWFSTEKILKDLPSVAPGQVIDLKRLQKEATRLNSHPDFKMTPEMKPGKTPETVDILLTVRDKSPWHGSVEVNNRHSHDTTALRLGTSLRHDNLWQKEHSLSVSYQVAPEKPEEVQVLSGSYTLPAPWGGDAKLVGYGVWSNNDTVTGGGFKNLGKGYIFGARAIQPLPPVGDYGHSAVMGFDYKDFTETTGLVGDAGASSPIKYLPFSVAYSSSLPDDSGATSFSAAVNVSFRGLVSMPREFEEKRYRSRANYIFLTGGVERLQRLPADFSLLVKFDGQVSDQPLVSNEQYSAGDADSVRGYRESEASGDNAIHAVFELAAPNLLRGEGKVLSPYLFFEGAGLWTKNAQEGQEERTGLKAAGFGVRGLLFESLEFQGDLGLALMDAGRTESGDARLHFKLKWQF